MSSTCGRSAGRWSGRRGRAACVACASGLLWGCGNPFGPEDEDYGRRIALERLRAVDPLGIQRYARPATPADAPAAPTEAPASRFAGLERASISLEEARAAALENNLELRVALVDPSIASQSLREAESKFESVFQASAGFRNVDNPVLDVTTPNQAEIYDYAAGVSVPLRTGGRARVDLTDAIQQTDNPFVTLNTSYTPAARFSISQPLLRNAGRRANTHSIRIAAYQAQIVESRTTLQVLSQLAATERSYWRLDAVRRELDVRQQQYELAQAQLERAQRQVAAGVAPEVEVIRAQSGVAERLEGIIVAENAVLEQQRELKRRMHIRGLEVDTTTLIETTTVPDPVPFEFDPAALTRLALDSRMELLEVELQLLADASQIDFNRNQRLPLLDVEGSYTIGGLGSTFSSSNEILWNNDFESWSFGVAGEVPLGNEAAEARLQRAVLTRLQRIGTREARRETVQQEVLSAIDRVTAGWQRILAARQAAVLAGRTLVAEQRQFEVGARTSTDVLDAAARLADAQSAEIRALADYQIAQVDLAVATGTLLGAARVQWEPLDPNIDDPTARPDQTQPTVSDAIRQR